MSKVYRVDRRRYLFDVMAPAAISAVLAPACIVLLVVGIWRPIAAIVLVVTLYTLFNTFVAKCYPRVVTLTDTSLSFESFGAPVVYELASCTSFSVRENGMTKSAYVRVNGGGLLHGRYFVSCGDMYDESQVRADDLYQFFLDLEERFDPNGLRVTARRSKRAPC